MVGRKKEQKEDERQNKYLDRFDQIVKTPEEPSFDVEAFRREGKKAAWIHSMKGYRETRNRMKQDPSKDYKIPYYGIDILERKKLLKAKADELMTRDSIADIKKAMELYSQVKLGKKESWASRPSVKGKLIKFIERNRGKYTPEQLLELRHYLGSSSRESLEGKTLMIGGIIGIVAALFFLSPVVTGNVIGSMNNGVSFSIGGVLFILGLAGLFISCKKK